MVDGAKFKSLDNLNGRCKKNPNIFVIELNLQVRLGI